MKYLILLMVPLFALGRGYTKDGFVPVDNMEQTKCSAQSTSSTYVDCFVVTLPTNSGYKLSADCTGIRSDNAEFGSVLKEALFRRATGVAILEGSVVVQFDQTGGAGWTMTLDVDSNDARVRVKSPVETVNWTCSIKLVKKL